MNHNKSNADPAAEEQAALWAARLDGDVLTAESRQELDVWLDQNPRHRAMLSDYCQLSADLETKLTALMIDGRVELPEAEPTPPPTRQSRTWWAVSGSLAAAAAIMIGFWFQHPTNQYESMATPVAQRETHALADGSEMEMDARTSLRVEIDATHRRVRLADGEVFLAVAKDPARPFIVETPLGSISVKGTKFDVRTINEFSLRVSVQEGVVQVSPNASGMVTATPILLTMGDQLTLNKKGSVLHKLSARELDDSLAWRQGQVVFKGTPLHEALARFARHHGVGIKASSSAAEQKIGGRFSLDDLDGFFSALEEVIPVRVSRNLNGTIRVDMRSELSGGTHRES